MVLDVQQPGSPSDVLPYREAGARIGEVVSTSSTEFEAQAIHLHETPPLGALVRVRGDGDCVLFAVVAGAGTEGMEMGTRVVPRGKDECEDAEIYREYPDLAYVLRTYFRCIVVGHRERGATYDYLPAWSAPIHYSVGLCSAAEVIAFTTALGYFRTVLAARGLPAEDVLAAHIRLAAQARSECQVTSESPFAFTVRAGREVATLLRSEYHRAAAILQCIRPVPMPTSEVRHA